MRKHLLQDFTHIYHIDLHGNVRKNPKLSGTTHNVFGIQVGVGITVAVRSSKHNDHCLFYHRVPEDWRREEKLTWLTSKSRIGRVEWRQLQSDSQYNWLSATHADLFASFIPIATKEGKASTKANTNTFFRTYSLGVSTNRDSVVYDFNEANVAQRIEQFSDDYNAEVGRFSRKGEGTNLDEFLDYSRVKWSSSLKAHLKRGTYYSVDKSRICDSLYRPFTKRKLYYDEVLVDRPGLFRTFFPRNVAGNDNMIIVISDVGYRSDNFNVLVTDCVADLHLLASTDAHQCFPVYVYNEEGTNQRENITDVALRYCRKHFGDESISKWDLFYYVYAVLHLPSYRETFADNLKRELARIPLMADLRPLAQAGKQLASLHLGYESLEPWPLEWVYATGKPLSYGVEKMKLDKDKTTLRINESLSLTNIPPEAFEYRLGNRSALEWVIDQYQVSEDKQSGITSDPNRPDDEEYIVRLVGQVVQVSVETVRILAELSATVSLPEA